MSLSSVLWLQMQGGHVIFSCCSQGACFIIIDAPNAINARINAIIQVLFLSMVFFLFGIFCFYIPYILFDMINDLVSEVVGLRDGEVGAVVDERLRLFEAVGESVVSCLFRELCFCLTTANCSAESCLVVEGVLKDDFLLLPLDELVGRLRGLGYRFPNKRAEYIVEARGWIHRLEGVLSWGDSAAVRDWLVDNIRGLGLKEASHFMRNVGFFDVAIVDYHIIDLLVRYGLVERPRSLTRKKYLMVEGVLREVADKAGMSLGELDLYLWYMGTGKVLK